MNWNWFRGIVDGSFETSELEYVEEYWDMGNYCLNWQRLISLRLSACLHLSVLFVSTLTISSFHLFCSHLDDFSPFSFWFPLLYGSSFCFFSFLARCLYREMGSNLRSGHKKIRKMIEKFHKICYGIFDFRCRPLTSSRFHVVGTENETKNSTRKSRKEFKSARKSRRILAASTLFPRVSTLLPKQK